MSLSVVESTHFCNLCEQLNPRFQVPRRSHLTKKLLHEKSSEIQSNLKCSANGDRQWGSNPEPLDSESDALSLHHLDSLHVI